MRMCFNRNVLIGLGVVAAIVLIVAPRAFLAALPVLLLLACPLSMVFMMRAMGGNQSASGERGSASHPAGSSSPTTTPDHSAEIIRLRAEVDQLRAAARDQQQAQRAGGAE